MPCLLRLARRLVTRRPPDRTDLAAFHPPFLSLSLSLCVCVCVCVCFPPSPLLLSPSPAPSPCLPRPVSPSPSVAHSFLPVCVCVCVFVCLCVCHARRPGGQEARGQEALRSKALLSPSSQLNHRVRSLGCSEQSRRQVRRAAQRTSTRSIRAWNKHAQHQSLETRTRTAVLRRRRAPRGPPAPTRVRALSSLRCLNPSPPPRTWFTPGGSRSRCASGRRRTS